VQFDAQDLSVRIPVYLQLERRRIREIGGTIPEINFIPELIERGLRAQLQLQSIVTGQLSVQLDILPNRPARYVDPVGEFPEMPTIPSSMQQFTETMESLSIEELVNDARQVLAGLKTLVNSPELAELLTGVNEFVNSGELLGLVTHTNEAIGDVQALVSNIDGRVGSLSTSVELTLTEASETLEEVQKTLNAARQALSIAAEGSPMRYEFEKMLGELTAAARSIRLLAEYLERNPDALVRGKPGGS
jgi:paraquat-inducible protein B